MKKASCLTAAAILAVSAIAWAAGEKMRPESPLLGYLASQAYGEAAAREFGGAGMDFRFPW